MTQREAAWPRFPPTDTIGRCKLALRQLTPAVVLHWVSNEAKTIVTQKTLKVNTPPKIFQHGRTISSKSLLEKGLRSSPSVQLATSLLSRIMNINNIQLIND